MLSTRALAGIGVCIVVVLLGCGPTLPYGGASRFGSSLKAIADGSLCELYILPAISNVRVTTITFPVPALVSTSLKVAACPGEREPATFVLRALQDLGDVTLQISDLVGEHGSLSSDTIDTRVVKCWFQSGADIYFENRRTLVPELLLKDDGLVRVDIEKRKNYLRFVNARGRARYVCISSRWANFSADIAPRDAQRLQPTTIPAGTTKQFWITLHVPPNAAGGDYSGCIRVMAGTTEAARLTLSVRVLPFALAEPRLLYSIYYRGVLSGDGSGSISSEKKSEAQYLAEMKDLEAHGVRYPTCYQGFDVPTLGKALELRAAAGISKGTFFGLGQGTGAAISGVDLARLSELVRMWRGFLLPYGYDQVYFYGIDEAVGAAQRGQREAWKAVRGAGGKVFVACSRGTAEAVGDLLDVAVYAGPPSPEEATRLQELGSRIFCYANPQVGVEEPETYRRNYGLLLWKAGYDGAMDYAYQHSFGQIWNDFDHPFYRDHVFAYPTVDGVVDTLAWEGFREGVDDVRYLSTLLDLIEAARRAGRKAGVAEEAERWIANLDVSGDLGEIRSAIIDRILKLLDD
jgi:hypothetical protein